jgi:hypothetical protein
VAGMTEELGYLSLDEIALMNSVSAAVISSLVKLFDDN